MKPPQSPLSFNFAVSMILFSLITPIVWFCWIQPLMLRIQANPAHATAIPWLQNEAACLETGRVWEGEACWDAEHDPNF
jgi:hypothetical protein